MVFSINDALHAAICTANNVSLFQVAYTSIAKGSNNLCVDKKRASAAASHDFYVGVDCKHALLSSPLCDDFQLVVVFFVSIAKSLYELLRVDRFSRGKEETRQYFSLRFLHIYSELLYIYAKIANIFWFFVYLFIFLRKINVYLCKER